MQVKLATVVQLVASEDTRISNWLMPDLMLIAFSDMVPTPPSIRGETIEASSDFRESINQQALPVMMGSGRGGGVLFSIMAS